MHKNVYIKKTKNMPIFKEKKSLSVTGFNNTALSLRGHEIKYLAVIANNRDINIST